MVYIDKETGEVGSLLKLLPSISNPIKLTEEELNELGVYKPIPDTTEIKPWQKVVRIDYDGINEVKVIEDIGLDKFKEQKLKEIKDTYYQLTNEGFECSNGIKLDCRESDKVNWMNLLQEASNSEDLQTLRDYYNNTHTISSLEVVDMMNELKAYYNKILKDKWTCEDIVKGYNTYQKVNNFYWRKAVYDENNEFVEWNYNEVL